MRSRFLRRLKEKLLEINKCEEMMILYEKNVNKINTLRKLVGNSMIKI